MRFIKVGRTFINLDQVAKVKKITRQGQDSLMVVFASEALDSQRFTGKNMEDLEVYLRRTSEDIREYAERVRKLDREVVQ